MNIPLPTGHLTAAPSSATRLFLFKSQQVNMNVKFQRASSKHQCQYKKSIVVKATKHVTKIHEILPL